MHEEWKRVLTGLFFLLGFMLLLMLAMNQWGCVPGDGKPAAYQAELVGCSQRSATLAESLACEDKVRAAYGRPPRDAGGE